MKWREGGEEGGVKRYRFIRASVRAEAIHCLRWKGDNVLRRKLGRERSFFHCWFQFVFCVKGSACVRADHRSEVVSELGNTWNHERRMLDRS